MSVEGKTVEIKSYGKKKVTKVLTFTVSWFYLKSSVHLCKNENMENNHLIKKSRKLIWEIGREERWKRKKEKKKREIGGGELWEVTLNNCSIHPSFKRVSENSSNF